MAVKPECRREKDRAMNKSEENTIRQPDPDESRLVDIYRQITGTGESEARCAVMSVIFAGRDPARQGGHETPSEANSSMPRQLETEEVNLEMPASPERQRNLEMLYENLISPRDGLRPRPSGHGQ
jgi:hypothetical protein